MGLKGCGVPLMASSKASFSDIGGKEMLRKTVGIYDKAHRDRKKNPRKETSQGGEWQNKVLLYDPTSPRPGLE